MAIDLSYLNLAQKEALLHDQGPLILIAGAGTGKTTVITQKLAYLVEQGKARPEEILALTFTEKAAGEMSERVDKLLPLGYADLWVHTFHGFCDRVLKNHAIDIGLSNDFKLLDTTAAWLLVRENLDKFNLDYYSPLGSPSRFIHALLTHFSRLKDEVISPEDYLEYAQNLQLDSDQALDREEREMEILRQRELANAYHVYQQLLLDRDAMDFGDLINYTLRLFQKRPQILKKFREQFKYILVDEFQDTNWAQYELVKILAAPKNNIMAVGDDDQAIYKFRGAAISNILNFKKDYPNLKEIFLLDNYRSGQKILDAAYDFIQLNNPDRLEYQYRPKSSKTTSAKSAKKIILNKKLVSHSDDKGEVAVLAYPDKDSEIDGILDKIMNLRKSDQSARWSDFAILVRANDQAQGFVSMMRKRGLPHQFMASRGLYAQDVVQDIVAYLKLLDNYHESPAFFRILSLGVTNLQVQTIIDLSHLASKKSWSLYYAAKNYPGQINLPLGEQRILTELLKNISQHTELGKTASVSRVIYQWLEDSGYLQMLTLEQNQYNQEQLHFLNQFFKKIRQWEEEALGDNSVHNFLAKFNLELESGEMGALQYDSEAGPDVIKVMTVHGAKGLEFKYVFITNLVHLRFPSIERKDAIEIPEVFIKETLPSGDAHLQEERRLFYVALTRAKKAVYLTWAKNYGGATAKKPSRFIDELDIASSEAKLSLEKPKDLNPKIEKVKYPLPKTFSFSQLKAYEACPWQYFYNFVAKVPSRGSAQFSFGKTMHSALQKFYQLMISRAEAKQGDLFGKNKKNIEPPHPTEKDLLEFYKQSWIDDWYQDQQQKDKYYQSGIKQLKEFYRKFKDNWRVPLFLEKGFTIKIKDYSLRGVFDRVDALAGGWEIIDYKTGRPKTKLDFDDKKQLLIYQIAAEEVFGQKINNLTFYYLENNQPLSFVGQEKDIAKTKDWIVTTIEKILSHDFSASPGHVCSYCDFKSVCPYTNLNKN
ncbi:MAG: UvrD-helicase domain-containing protein [Patescibacteria group bacterium]|nr:UvrD-helicase domain-containing protein [Patescibacteria group bacterium]